MSCGVVLRPARDVRAPSVLFLHGFASGPAAWSRVAAAMRHRGELSASVLPGHGLPPRPLPHGGFAAAVDVLAHDISRAAFVVGYSLGARLGLGLATAHPERVRGVVAIGAHLGLEGEPERAERRAWEAELRELLERDGVAAFVERWQALPLFDTQRARLSEPAFAARFAEQRALRASHDAGALGRAVVALGTGSMPPLAPRLRRNRTPIALVAGEHDDRFVRELERGALLGPHVTTRVVAGVGHNVALEAPERLAAVLDEQLDRWSRAKPLESRP